MLTDAGLRTRPIEIHVPMTSGTSSRLRRDATRFPEGLCCNNRARGLLPISNSLESLTRPGDLPGRPGFIVLQRFCRWRRRH